jgi:hypothetical protein
MQLSDTAATLQETAAPIQLRSAMWTGDPRDTRPHAVIRSARLGKDRREYTGACDSAPRFAAASEVLAFLQGAEAP